jgi:hypothetical protein
MFQTKAVEKIRTHILCSVTFFRKSYRLWDNVEKYATAGQTTDDSIIRRMRIAWWIPKTTDTHRICYTYCFSTATMVTRTLVSVALYAQCTHKHYMMYRSRCEQCHSTHALNSAENVPYWWILVNTVENQDEPLQATAWINSDRGLFELLSLGLLLLTLTIKYCFSFL